jgi:hypothetical protein
MADLPSAVNIKEIVSLFAPGMILLWARSRVQAGSTPDFQERLISYAMASTAYFATVSPLFYIATGLTLPSWLWSLLLYAIVPGSLGWALAYLSQRKWEYKAAYMVGLRFSHRIPTAWDFTFGEMEKQVFVLVTLKGGSQIGGLMGAASFASSDSNERDLLIEEVWTINDSKEWTRAEPSRSALLCGNNIDYIEIFEGGSDA